MTMMPRSYHEIHSQRHKYYDDDRVAYSMPVPIPKGKSPWREPDKEYQSQCEYALLLMSQRLRLAGIRSISMREKYDDAASEERQSSSEQRSSNDHMNPEFIFGMD